MLPGVLLLLSRALQGTNGQTDRQTDRNTQRLMDIPTYRHNRPRGLWSETSIVFLDLPVTLYVYNSIAHCPLFEND